MNRRSSCRLVLAAVITMANACSSSEDSTPATSSSPTSSTDHAKVSIDAQAALTQTADAAFDPHFVVQIPSDWTAIARDIWAFQIYAGNEDYEITFDHTYREKESVEQAMARLAGTDNLEPGPVSPLVVGGLEGRSFVATSQSEVQFVDSGFHTNEASTLEVAAIPMADGTTVSVFLTSGGDPEHGLEVLGPLARRIFDTVQWQ